MSKKAAQVTFNDLEMMKDPYKWPCWPFLPLKRRNHDLSSKNLGILLDDGKKTRTIYHVYLYALPTTSEGWRTAPQTIYESEEAIRQDGWVVD